MPRMHAKLKCNRGKQRSYRRSSGCAEPCFGGGSQRRLLCLCRSSPFYQASFVPFALDPSPDPELASIGFGTGDANPSAYQWVSVCPAPSASGPRAHIQASYGWMARTRYSCEPHGSYSQHSKIWSKYNITLVVQRKITSRKDFLIFTWKVTQMRGPTYILPVYFHVSWPCFGMLLNSKISLIYSYKLRQNSFYVLTHAHITDLS